MAGSREIGHDAVVIAQAELVVAEVRGMERSGQVLELFSR